MKKTIEKHHDTVLNILTEILKMEIPHCHYDFVISNDENEIVKLRDNSFLHAMFNSGSVKAVAKAYQEKFSQQYGFKSPNISQLLTELKIYNQDCYRFTDCHVIDFFERIEEFLSYYCGLANQFQHMLSI